jgi:hypothetical protein
MNPWRLNFFELCRNVLRFALWTCLTLNGLMLGCFLLVFVFQFLRHLWGYCHRTLFSNSW